VRVGWLLSALGLLLLAALCCAYLSLCLLFAQGGWQLLYQPGHTVNETPAARALAFTPVRFGINEAGTAELTGWWVPAPSGSSGEPTVLYLHDGRGTLSDTIPALIQLHTLGCSIFAIDYRGFGASTPAHASERLMIEDALSAVHYLEDTRHISPDALVLWGKGTGATIAAEAAVSGQSIPVVLEAVLPPALELLRGENRLRLLPVRLLLEDRLDPRSALQSSAAPKLFLAASPRLPADPTFRDYTAAATPKQLADPADLAAQRLFLASTLKHAR
jgi:pimeloyl-ACP methyl ester carboxylesterase